MAFLFVDLTQNNNRYVRISVKITELLLLSAGLFSTLLMVKGALPPYSCELVFSSLIGFWTSITCFLSSPLSICIIIHVMVVLILASSSLFGNENGHQDDEISIVVGDYVVQLADSLLVSPPPPAPPPPPPPPNTPTNEGEDDTMDATWKAITGQGNQKAKKKHLKKSETCLDSEILLPTTPKWKELRKAETFNDEVSVTRRGGLVRRDPSMSIEEFNLQVDAFIKKFNDNIRLQRQESDQRFFQTINRGL